VTVTDFDPVGSRASIGGGWTIDEGVPNAFRCRALGAQRVRVTFLDGERPVPHSGLFFQCDLDDPENVEQAGFDTREASGEVVEAGCWTIRLDAIDGAGAVVATGPASDWVVPGDDVDTAGCEGPTVDHIALPTADFLSARVIARTTIDGARSNEASCEALGVERVRITFEEVGEGRVDGDGRTGVTEVSEPCAFGRLSARVLAPSSEAAEAFRYVARLELVRADGSVIQGTAETFEVGRAGAACYFGGGCRPFCNGDDDCAEGSCSQGQCLAEGQAADPEVEISGL